MTLRDREMFGRAEGTPDRESGPVPALRRGIPLFCGGLILVCVGVFVAEVAGLVPRSGDFQLGALNGPRVLQGEWWRIWGTAIEHGGPFHLFMNMSVVYTLGVPFERSVRAGRMAVISWVTAMGSSTFALLFNFDAVTVGASGMILGWAGALIPVATSEVRRSLLIWLLQIAFISALPGVSWAGHLGGFLFGLPCGFALKLGGKRFAWLAPILMGVSSAAAIAAARVGGIAIR